MSGDHIWLTLAIFGTTAAAGYACGRASALAAKVAELAKRVAALEKKRDSR